MDEKKLDDLIEKNIKDFSMEVDLSQPIMERIEDFETRKAPIKRPLSVIVTVYTVIASLLSIFFVEKLGQYFTITIAKYQIDFTILKYALQGIFIFILGVIVLLFVYFKPWKRSPNSI